VSTGCMPNGTLTCSSPVVPDPRGLQGRGVSGCGAGRSPRTTGLVWSQRSRGQCR
jgi:hypothetical protein